MRRQEGGQIYIYSDVLRSSLIRYSVCYKGVCHVITSGEQIFGFGKA